MRVVGSILRQVVAVENWSCLVSLTSFQDNTGCWFCFLLPYIFVLNHHSFFLLQKTKGTVLQWSPQRERQRRFLLFCSCCISLATIMLDTDDYQSPLRGLRFSHRRALKKPQEPSTNSGIKWHSATSTLHKEARGSPKTLFFIDIKQIYFGLLLQLLHFRQFLCLLYYVCVIIIVVYSIPGRSQTK